MICRYYLDNFFADFLYNQLSTPDRQLSTVTTHSYWFIINYSAILSTILFFGAKIISLYLFSAKNSGKVVKFP